MGKHTPGPWYRDGRIIWAGNGPTKIAAVPASGLDEHDANASLIVAAPELLEALSALAALIEPCESCEGTGHARGNTKEDEACRCCGGVGEVFALGVTGEIGTIRAAIAKAEGRSNG